jgi:uncharacterized membrane protein YgdD (TMEM256/DUF423 family)
MERQFIFYIILDSQSENIYIPLMKKIDWIMIGAIFGAFAVALGAFGAHALKGKLDSYGESIYAKAVLYHMFHVVGILIVGVLMKFQPDSRAYASGFLFLIGIILFSGSLYTLAVTGIRGLGMITPFGGIAFIAGWIGLAFSAK